MARTRGSRPRQHKTPTRLVDGTGLEDRLTQTIIDEFISPIEVRVEELEDAAAAALTRGVVHQADVELRAGWHGGTVILRPAGGFVEDAIGRPVLVTQGPTGDSDEGGIVLFTGDVLDRERLRLRWFSAVAAPRRVNVVYLIG